MIDNESIKECVIGGEHYFYNDCYPCDKRSLEKTKRLRPNLNYMGKGKITLVDGVDQKSETEYYFFKRK